MLNFKNITLVFFLLQCSFPLPKNQKVIEVYNISKTKSVKFAQNRKWIGFDKNFHISLDSLKGFPNLKSLEIRSTKFENLKGIYLHSNLTFLNLSYSSVKNLKPLKKLPKLRTVILNHTKVNDSSFDKFKLPANITRLFLAYTNISNLDFLTHKCSLRILDIRKTKVAHLKPLRYCKKLLELKIGNSLVKDIDELLKLENLNYLEMDNIEVSKESLRKLKKTNQWLKITF